MAASVESPGKEITNTILRSHHQDDRSFCPVEEYLIWFANRSYKQFTGLFQEFFDNQKKASVLEGWIFGMVEGVSLPENGKSQHLVEMQHYERYSTIMNVQ